jgi:hypothetical protein
MRSPRPLPPNRRCAVWLPLIIVLGGWWSGLGAVPRAFAAPANARSKAGQGLRLRSTQVLPANAFEPLIAYSHDGTTLWLARLEEDRLRLTARDSDGKVIQQAVVPGLTLRQPPTGMVATAKGMMVYGDTATEGGWFAYTQLFDEKGTPGRRGEYRGAIAIRSVVVTDDGGMTMLVHAFAKVEMHGVSVVGPSSTRRDLPAAVLLGLDASGVLAWSRPLDDATVARDPWLVGADDGQVALLLGEGGAPLGAEGPYWHGGAVLRWSRGGKPLGKADKLASVGAAAFDHHGTLWVLGQATLAGSPPRILPPRKVPYVLDAYRPELDRRVLCKRSCLHRPSLAVDGEGAVVFLAAVVRPFRFGGIRLSADRVLAERWSLLQIDGQRLRARHTLTTTHVRLAVARTGRVAVVVTGVRGVTTLDGRRVGKKGETVLLQFDH